MINAMKRFGLAVAGISLLVGTAEQARAEMVINVISGSSTADHNGAIYAQTDYQPAGTGVFNTFLRTEAKGNEKGYNTDGQVEFDTMSDPHTHAIPVTDVPVITINDVAYREFLLDINESQGGAKRLLSLNRLELYLTSDPMIRGFDPTTGPGDGFGSKANLVYSLDGGANGNGTVELDSSIVKGGSGKADMYLYVRDSLFTAAYDGSNNYVVLFNQFGNPNQSDAGFEEWGLRDGGGPELRLQAVPEPSSLVSSGIAAVMGLGVYSWRRRSKAKRTV